MHKDMYIRWLNDAYAMERALEQVLRQQVKVTDNAEAREKISDHIDATHRHGEIIRERIDAIGADVADTKAALAKVFGALDGLAMGLPSDKAIKNTIGNYAIESLEIAAYSALMVAAEAMNDTETLEACEMIRAEEQEMASWIADHIPMATQDVLDKMQEKHRARA